MFAKLFLSRTVREQKVNKMNKLIDIKKMDKIIQGKLQELEQLNEMLTKVNVSDYTKERIQSSHEPDAIADVISKIHDLEREINRDVEFLMNLKQELMKKVDQLQNPLMIELAYKRYFAFKTFEQIADEMNLSVRWVLELNKQLMNLDL